MDLLVSGSLTRFSHISLASLISHSSFLSLARFSLSVSQLYVPSVIHMNIGISLVTFITCSPLLLFRNLIYYTKCDSYISNYLDRSSLSSLAQLFLSVPVFSYTYIPSMIYMYLEISLVTFLSCSPPSYLSLLIWLAFLHVSTISNILYLIWFTCIG